MVGVSGQGRCAASEMPVIQQNRLLRSQRAVVWPMPHSSQARNGVPLIAPLRGLGSRMKSYLSDNFVCGVGYRGARPDRLGPRLTRE